MVTMSIRGVPEATRDRIASKATEAGQSIQEYMLGVLEREAVREDPRALLRSRTESLRDGGSTLTPAEVVGVFREIRSEE